MQGCCVIGAGARARRGDPVLIASRELGASSGRCSSLLKAL